MTVIRAAKEKIKRVNVEVEKMHDSRLKDFLSQSIKGIDTVIMKDYEFMEEAYFDEANYLFASVIDRLTLEQAHCEQFFNFRKKEFTDMKILFLDAWQLTMKAYFYFLGGTK